MTAVIQPRRRGLSQVSPKCVHPSERAECLAKEGDVIDFSKLYRTHAGEVHRFVLFLSGDPALADDILSETFIRLWHARDRVDLTTVKGYLLAIARAPANRPAPIALRRPYEKRFSMIKCRRTRRSRLPETLSPAPCRTP
jgi:hypothetical protein